MSKNDDKILKLREQIEKKKKELKNNCVKFTPQTNCVLTLDGKTYNLNVCNKEELTLLMIKLYTYEMSANDLDISSLVISGFNIEWWILDIKNKLKMLEIKEETEKLKSNEELLEQLLSEDKKTELMLDEIAKTLE